MTMRDKSIGLTALLAMALLAITGCTPPLPVLPNQITPNLVGQASPDNPYYHAICVRPGAAYKDTMDGYSIDVVPDTMVIALSQTLFNNDLRAPENDCQYILTATITHIGHYLFTVPFAPIHAFSTVDYTIVRAQTNATVLNKSISVDHAQDFEFQIPAYIGTMDTIFDSVNGSIQDNIRTFVKTLK